MQSSARISRTSFRTRSRSALRLWAAPGFVSAAIDGEAGERFELGGKLLTARTQGEALAAGATELAAEGTIPTARIRSDRTVDILPDASPDEPGLIVVDITDPPSAAVIDAEGRRARDRRGRLELNPQRWRLPAADQRLVRLAAILLGIVVVSAVFFGLRRGCRHSTPSRTRSSC